MSVVSPLPSGLCAPQELVDHHTRPRGVTEDLVFPALRASGAVLWQWDPEADRLTWSDNLTEVLGCTLDTPQEFEQRVHPADQERHRQALTRTLRDGVPADTEIRFITPDGTTIWLQHKADKQPDRRTVSGIFLDITARRAADEALHADKVRWQGIFEGMQEGFFLGEAIRDSTGRMIDLRFVEVNPAFETLTGMQAHATVGRTALEFAPGGQGKLIGTYAKVIDTGQAQRFEAQVTSLNSRWYEVSARPAGPDQVAVLFVEVTARKRAEKQARAGAALLKATVDNLDQGLIMFDASETIRIFNKRAAELLDIPAEYLATHPTFSELVQRQVEKDDFAKNDEVLRNWITQSVGAATRQTYERERPDGTVLEVRTVPLEGGGAFEPTPTSPHKRRQSTPFETARLVSGR